VLTITPALRFATGVQRFLSRAPARRLCFTSALVDPRPERAASTALLPDGLRPVEAILQHLHQIHHVGRRWRRCRFRGDLLVLRLLFDDLHECRPVSSRYFSGPRNRSYFRLMLAPFSALCRSPLSSNRSSNVGTQYFAGKVHQLENQEQTVGLYCSQVFTIADYNFGDTDLAGATERLVQNCVGFSPPFCGSRKYGL